jgi:predicted transposase YbfD/YdcC
MRGSARKDCRPLHVVSAWASECGITLGQVAVNEKNNEIGAIPELLKLLDIRGSVVTIDAMGSQTAIASALRAKGADYLLALKGNHKTFYNTVVDTFKAIKAGNSELVLDSFYEETNDHGRIEWRKTTVIAASNIKDHENWGALIQLYVVNICAIKKVSKTILSGILSAAFRQTPGESRIKFASIGQ